MTGASGRSEARGTRGRLGASLGAAALLVFACTNYLVVAPGDLGSSSSAGATTSTGGSTTGGTIGGTTTGGGTTGGSTGGSCRSDPSGVVDCCESGNGCYNGWFCDLSTCVCQPTDPCSTCLSQPSGVPSCCHAGAGCYGGWFCNLSNCECQVDDPCAPTGGSSGGTTGAGSTTGSTDAGP